MGRIRAGGGSPDPAAGGGGACGLFLGAVYRQWLFNLLQLLINDP